jgi:hypothetical protein
MSSRNKAKASASVPNRGDKLNATLPMMASIFECFLMLSREHVVIAMLDGIESLLRVTTNRALKN